MRILHILSKDVTPEQENRFLRLLDVLMSVSHEHSALSCVSKTIEEALAAKHIPHDIQKFGGMFDLRTKKSFENIENSFRPHIIISHSENSAAFTHHMNKKRPHIALISGDGTDRTIASYCDHTIMIGEKTKDEDILKTALSRFEKVLKQYEEGACQSS